MVKSSAFSFVGVKGSNLADVPSQTSEANPHYAHGIPRYGSQLRSLLVLVMISRIGGSFYYTVRCHEVNRNLITAQIA